MSPQLKDLLAAAFIVLCFGTFFSAAAKLFAF